MLSLCRLMFVSHPMEVLLEHRKYLIVRLNTCKELAKKAIFLQISSTTNMEISKIGNITEQQYLELDAEKNE